MKQFNIMHNIGKARYCVNYNDGVKTHNDGSPFFAIAIFSNKKKMDSFIKQLESEGFKQS